MCDFCGKEHYKNKCELRLLTAVVADFELAKARDEEKPRPSKIYYGSNKEKALAAQDQVDGKSSESENSSNSSAEDDEEVDYCHF
ncbi:hypothetical protein K3495_g435 [Podosphaera aphanis]|nr:hypothetical protein K3495_g435 [Podosphaera aphanis]